MTKALFVMFFGLALCQSPLLFASDATDMALVQKKAALQVGSDVVTSVTLLKNEIICGLQGDAYLVEVKVRHFDKVINSTPGHEGIELKERWETIKTYAMMKAEIYAKNARFIDQEACLE